MLCAVLAFFAPCEYELPRQHFARVLQAIRDTGTAAVVAQLVRPGRRPIAVPPGVANALYESEHVLFHKENLWNLAVGLTDADALVFFDSDVLLSLENWPLLVERALDWADIIQPFSVAEWLSRDGKPFMRRASAAAALARGMEPRADRYHPGFSWAMRRTAFDALGGFWDRHPAGGGDVAFSYAIDRRLIDCDLSRSLPADTQSWRGSMFRAYRESAGALGLRVGYLHNVVARHLWHGDWKNRLYMDRCRLFPEPVDGNYELIRRPDGLLEWAPGIPPAAALNYFMQRREDG